MSLHVILKLNSYVVGKRGSVILWFLQRFFINVICVRSRYLSVKADLLMPTWYLCKQIFCWLFVFDQRDFTFHAFYG